MTTVIDVSAQQAEALDAVRRWRKAKNSPQIFRLFGYAGTGKTTIAKMLASEFGRTHYAAYTGKAASVMRKKGCTGASTLHSLIYSAVPYYKCPDGHEFELDGEDDAGGDCPDCGKKLRRRFSYSINPKSKLHGADLLIIDECSMVGPDLALDVMSFGVPILVLGDTAQLPPVRGAGYFTDETPDILLTEIHRQLLGDPILSLATAMRNGKRPPPGDYGSVTITGVRHKENIPPEYLPDTNAFLHWINREVRKQRGFTDPLPVIGDRIACLRNDKEKGLLNGTLWDVEEVTKVNEFLLSMQLVSEEGDQTCEVVCHTLPFTKAKLTSDEEAIIDGYQQFTYGYAMTVHKSQGSQWDSVIIYDESAVLANVCEPAKWLYTGVTRAARQLTLIQIETPKKTGPWK
jgi:exodeoxyribonuclease V